MQSPSYNCDAVIIGIGNPLLSDDRAGLQVIDELEKSGRYKDKNIKFVRNYSGGIDLLDDLDSAARAIIVDSILLTDEHETEPVIIPFTDEVSDSALGASHGLTIPAVVALGRKLGMQMPAEIVVCAIPGSEFTRFSMTPTVQVENRIKISLEKIFEVLYNWKLI